MVLFVDHFGAGSRRASVHKVIEATMDTNNRTAAIQIPKE